MNGLVVNDPSKKIKTGDDIFLSIPNPKKTSLKPFNYKLDIIFEDKDLIALNSNQNKSWDIDIEQTQRFDIEGKIGEKLILKPIKWYVDSDYWIADMSLLGKTEEIVQESLDEITVVPNPYIVSSKYNESANLKQLSFMHLPDECTISIYTITGELVDVITHGPASIKSSTTWDLRNQ